MVAAYAIRRNQYYDSIYLMRIARRLSEVPGILDSAVIMGTDRNKSLLADMGFADPEIASASPEDLMVAVKAETGDIAESVLGNLDAWLEREPDSAGRPVYRTIDSAMAALPSANLALVSLPGEYAAGEARRALERGLNVFLFSDNVPVEREIELKQLARERGLVVMGPDCGTAIIAGVGVGFANAVRRGPIGVVGASGTGIQEITSLVHSAGSGISHAIGTGSRDLKDVVGGISTFAGLQALESDPDTKVIVVVSKPSGKATTAALLEKLGALGKPVVACLLGFEANDGEYPSGISFARTMEEAAMLAVRQAAGAGLDELNPPPSIQGVDLSRLLPSQRYLRGLFAGGTFCYQAQLLAREAGIEARSNTPISAQQGMLDARMSTGHCLVDMGDDLFTQGRPHPMIDSRLRCERILAEASDPETAVLLLDVILGYNASPDPAGDLAQAIAEARSAVERRGGYLPVVVSVCGTDGDPQGLERQTGILRETGAVVFQSSAGAARYVIALVRELENRR